MTPSAQNNRSDLRKALVVRLDRTLYALPLEMVVEVLPALPVERLPSCPTFLKGVVSVGGQLIPLLDVAERLRLARTQAPMEPHIVCVRVDDRIIGLEFDEALDLIDLSSVDMLTAAEAGASAGFFAGVVDHNGEVIRLLAPEKLLSREQRVLVSEMS